MQLPMVFFFLIMTGATQCYGSTVESEQERHAEQPHNDIQDMPDSKNSTLVPFAEPIPDAVLKQQHIFDLFNNGSAVCPSKNGMFYFTGICNIIFVCTDGKPEFFRCISSMEFNPELLICDLPHRTDCDIQEQTVSSKAQASNPPSSGTPLSTNSGSSSSHSYSSSIRQVQATTRTVHATRRKHYNYLVVGIFIYWVFKFIVFGT